MTSPRPGTRSDPSSEDQGERAAFIVSATGLSSPPLVPELYLHLADEITPLWQATEDAMATEDLPPPFWAFAWAGGQALARYVLDNPETVSGRTVLDFAAGSGLVGLAALSAGAQSVTVNDIDPYAATAQRLNCAANGRCLSQDTSGYHVHEGDIVGDPVPWADVILVGDVCYEREPAGRIFTWLQSLAAAGRLVLMGDPGRPYLPDTGLSKMATYRVPTTKELEDRPYRDTTIWRVHSN